MRYLIFTLIAIVCVTDVTRSHAAEFILSKDEECSVRLVGVVQKGDFDKLSKLSFDWNSHRNPILCLDSQGGSLSESVKIAEWVLGAFRLTTKIEENANCYSGCALIFMMGHFEEGDGHTRVSRLMHYRSKLGFHRPSLEVQLPPMVERGVALGAFDVALEAVLKFVKLAGSKKGDLLDGFFKNDLLELTLEAASSEMFIVETVNHAGRWEIQIFGFERPSEIDVLAAARACNNLTTWGKELVFNGYPDLESYREKIRFLGGSIGDVRLGNDTYHVIGVDAGYADHSCIIAWGNESWTNDKQIKLCGKNWRTRFELGGAGCSPEHYEDHLIAGWPEFQPIAFLDENTLLSEVQRGFDEIAARLRDNGPSVTDQ